VDLGRDKATQVNGRPSHTYQDKPKQEKGKGTMDNGDHGNCPPNHSEDLSEGEAAAPADPLHAEAPDHRPASLSHHVESTGHPGHGRLPGQVNADQGIDGKSGNKASRAETLGQEEHEGDLLGDAVVILHISYPISFFLVAIRHIDIYNYSNFIIESNDLF
jgi:hypothetical protein